MTATLIWSAAAVYALIAVGVAILSRSVVTNGQTVRMSGYFLGERRMNGLVSALSYSATTYSAFMMVGLAGLTYAGGVGALGFEIVYFAGVSLVAIFGPKFWSVGKTYGFVTPSEMLGYRYQSRAVAMATALASCVFLIPYAAVQLAGVGFLLSGMTDNVISFTAGALIATVLALVFSFVAGIRSVMWTDSLQALLMIVAATLVAAFVVQGLGGFHALFSRLAETRPETLTVPGPGLFSFATFVGLSVPWFFFSLSNPQVSQRLYMPESLPAMRRMLIGFLIFGLIYTLVSVIWGFAALVVFDDLPKSDMATPRLLASQYVPPALGVAVTVGIMAAAVSTIDSIMLTLTSMISRDIYAQVKPEASENKQLSLGKWVLPLIAIAAFVFAELQLDLIAMLSVAASTGLAVTVPAIIGAFYWKRGTAAGALASIVGGGVCILTLEISGLTPFGLAAGVWVLPVSAGLFFAISLLTQPSTATAEAFMRAADRR